jgi:hypothetical protein
MEATPMTLKSKKLQIAKGKQIISSAEFAFGFGDIKRDEFDSRIAEGNRLILNALDGLWA